MWSQLACLAVALWAFQAAADRPQYALIVANNASNDPKVPALKFADDDGARYYELFAPQSREVVLLWVLDDETQRRHPGLAARTRPPTRRELLEALARLNEAMAADRKRGDEPVLYFVFTGHGQRGQAGEGSISLLGESFTRSELYEQVLAKSEAAYLHLIVDACDSYFFVNSRGSLPVAKAQADAVLSYLDEKTLARYPNVGVVLSTNNQQESHEWSAISAGVFSHQVRSALAGAADVNGDGRVEYSELRAFVAAANSRIDDPRAQVRLFAQAPSRNRSVPLADLGRRSSFAYLMLPAELSGRYWVEDERGVRLAELHKERERALLLAVPAGRTLFLRSFLKEARFQAMRPGTVVDAGGLSFELSAVASRGPIEDQFREKLFATPFGPRFYGGFVSSSGELPVAPPPMPDLTE